MRLRRTITIELLGANNVDEQEKTERPLVLVIDDDEGIREGIVDLLEEAGFAAVGSCNGLDALNFLAESPRKPSLILLDLQGPAGRRDADADPGGRDQRGADEREARTAARRRNAGQAVRSGRARLAGDAHDGTQELGAAETLTTDAAIAGGARFLSDAAAAE
jgi:CheY-like chemotaxis protein